jgi:hypothetical protein
MAAFCIETGTEVVVIDGSEFCTELNVESAFGKSGFDRSRGGLGNRWKRMWTPGHLSPPYHID